MGRFTPRTARGPRPRPVVRPLSGFAPRSVLSAAPKASPMLSLFRTGIGNVVVAGIAFLIIVAFAIEFRAGRSGPSGKLARECAVAYAGYCVDTKEYYAAHGMIVPRGVEPKVSKKYSFNKRVLDGLIERELLVAEADKLGLRVGEESLEADLMAGRVRASLPADSMAELSPMLGLCPPSNAGYA